MRMELIAPVLEGSRIAGPVHPETNPSELLDVLLGCLACSPTDLALGRVTATGHIRQTNNEEDR